MSRVKMLPFSKEGMAPKIVELLAFIWAQEAGNAPPPNFARIVKDAKNNCRDAINTLEIELIASDQASSARTQAQHCVSSGAAECQSREGQDVSGSCSDFVNDEVRCCVRPRSLLHAHVLADVYHRRSVAVVSSCHLGPISTSLDFTFLISVSNSRLCTIANRSLSGVAGSRSIRMRNISGGRDIAFRAAKRRRNGLRRVPRIFL